MLVGCGLDDNQVPLFLQLQFCRFCHAACTIYTIFIDDDVTLSC